MSVKLNITAVVLILVHWTHIGHTYSNLHIVLHIYILHILANEVGHSSIRVYIYKIVGVEVVCHWLWASHYLSWEEKNAGWPTHCSQSRNYSRKHTAVSPHIRPFLKLISIYVFECLPITGFNVSLCLFLCIALTGYILNTSCWIMQYVYCAQYANFL